MYRSNLRVQLAMEVDREGQLSEYDLMRERNIIKNHEFMDKCGRLVYISLEFVSLLAYSTSTYSKLNRILALISY